jgi:hypothetical protein
VEEDHVVDRLIAEVDLVLEMNLLPEQREVLADALVTRLDLEARTLPPRLREVAARLNQLLDELELLDSPQERAGWAVTIAYDLTSAEKYKSLDEMSDDEFEREIERRDKYGPDL